jgi:hypothetical protein
MSISLILFIIAGILALLDIVLGFVPNRRAWFLTPVAVLLIVIAALVGGGAISG